MHFYYCFPEKTFSIGLHAVVCRRDRAVNLLNNHSIGSQGSAWHAEGLSRGGLGNKDTRTAPGTGTQHYTQGLGLISVIQYSLLYDLTSDPTCRRSFIYSDSPVYPSTHIDAGTGGTRPQSHPFPDDRTHTPDHHLQVQAAHCRTRLRNRTNLSIYCPRSNCEATQTHTRWIT